MVCFAIIYASHLNLLAPADKNPSRTADAIYFAVLAQLTISFGNPVPRGWLRYVAAAQGLCGLVLVVLIISRVMSSLPPLQALDDRNLPPSS